ncbi:MAG: hemerythrin family protein [Deltaproteobacteria bacterium]|jgi:hemerythrin|nr:hemerythrin family protein [Deltaproteobacteria bacterium]
MPLMEWTPKLSVGIGQFDGEHQKLVGMVNDLFDAVQAGRGKDRLGPILDGLIAYTKTHFAAEERLMQQHQYPTFAAHKAEHDALTKQVLDVQQKFNGGATAALSMEVMSFLKNWLVKHILGTDKSYGPYLNQKGVK